MQSIIHAWPPFCVFLCVPHLSSSSSMKPLPSTSRTLKTLLTFSAVMAFNPTISKNFLGSNVSATKGKTESIDRCKHLPKCLPEIHQLFNNCGFKLVAQTVCKNVYICVHLLYLSVSKTNFWNLCLSVSAENTTCTGRLLRTCKGIKSFLDLLSFQQICHRHFVSWREGKRGRGQRKV